MSQAELITNTETQTQKETTGIPSASNDLLSVPSYLSCLSKAAIGIKLNDGQTADVWEISTPTDALELSNWAKLFRQQYCPDADLDELLD
jgi:hypothetical protein